MCIRMKRGVPNAVLIKNWRRVIKEAQGNNGIEDELGTSRALLNFLWLSCRPLGFVMAFNMYIIAQ